MTLADVKQRLRNYRLPPQTLRELGLEDDWASNVSDEFIANVLAICERHEGLLRREGLTVLLFNLRRWFSKCPMILLS